MPPQTHALVKLCAMCAEKDVRFSNITDECGYLTQFGTQFRYPHEVPISENNVAKAIADAETVSRFGPLLELRAKLVKGDTKVAKGK
ncbi:hypothetical protein AGMMS50267_04680 [Spirochaetia bacterium]|nr:hypothetical protein AGMMS50267_04680 [Spirochaetia bacterium]